jgi:hypothetical protein
MSEAPLHQVVVIGVDLLVGRMKSIDIHDSHLISEVIFIRQHQSFS